LARQLGGAADAAPRIARLCFLNGGLFPETHRARPIQRLLASPLGPWLVRTMRRSSFGRSLNAIFAPAHPLSEAQIDAYWALLRHEDGIGAIPSLLAYMAERRARRARWVGALQAGGTSDGAGNVPLRLICGALDPVSGVHLAQRYRALVPDADVVLLEDVGHYPQLEAPERTAAAAIAFFGAHKANPDNR
jgi:pimeloyl-ACP methyl ester carboxylesterase